MLFKIALICEEVEDFYREILIDEESTFLDLNKAILSSCGYSDDQMTCFYICDDEWEQKTQITREDMGFSSADEDIYVMEDTRLNELIEDEGLKMVFVFDPFSDRVFYVEVQDTIIGENISEPKCTAKIGKAPTQIIIEEPVIEPKKNKTIIPNDDDLNDEEFYGSEGFNSDEFDPEGFEFGDEDSFNQ